MGGLIINIAYRFSRKSDLRIILTLLEKCFGDRSDCNIDPSNGGFLLAFDGRRLVAMTGLSNVSADSNQCDIDWTCCDPEYRGNGIISHMLDELLKDEKRDIYCSCLVEPTKEIPNLHGILSKRGFHCVEKGHIVFCASDKMHFPFLVDPCKICNFRTGDNCTCREDLYFRKGTNT